MEEHRLEGEALGQAFFTVLQSATFAAVARLAEIIAEGEPEDALAACETLFAFALELTTHPEED